MLLILTQRDDATADYLTRELATAGIPYRRLDTDSALERATVTFSAGRARLQLDGETLDATGIQHVWYRRPGPLALPSSAGTTPEAAFLRAEWSEALEGFLALIPRERWMNHPAANACASHKLEQLHRAHTLGFTIPDTIVTQDPAALRDFHSKHNARIITKPMSTGYVDRDGVADSLIFTSPVRASELDALDDLSACPTLFQQYVEKRLDVRVTVVDEAVHAVALAAHDVDGRQRCDIRRNHMADVKYSSIVLPTTVREQLRALVVSYGLRFAAIDMVVSDCDEWYFLEVNPNGQWAWLDIAGATRIATSFIEAFTTPVRT